MATTIQQVQAQHPEFSADEIASVVTADPSLDAAGVAAALADAREEHAANQTHEAQIALREGVSRAEVDRLFPHHRLGR
jgi:predicted negative regulator of RcsB-dependent stress response